MKVMVFAISQLPTRGQKNMKKPCDAQDLFQIFNVSINISVCECTYNHQYKFQANENIEEVVKNIKQTQPIIICSSDTYYIKLDQKAIRIGTNFMTAFDILFKCFYVFNVEYSTNLKLFFNLFEVYFFGMTPNKFSSKIDIFYKTIMNVST